MPGGTRWVFVFISDGAFLSGGAVSIAIQVAPVHVQQHSDGGDDQREHDPAGQGSGQPQNHDKQGEDGQGCGDAGQVEKRIRFHFVFTPYYLHHRFVDYLGKKSRGASFSNGVLVGLTPGGEVDGVAGNFDLDLVHRGTVSEPGGGQDGGSDERKGEDDADDGVHFHGDFRLLSCEAI